MIAIIVAAITIVAMVMAVAMMGTMAMMVMAISSRVVCVC